MISKIKLIVMLFTLLCLSCDHGSSDKSLEKEIQNEGNLDEVKTEETNNEVNYCFRVNINMNESNATASGHVYDSSNRFIKNAKISINSTDLLPSDNLDIYQGTVSNSPIVSGDKIIYHLKSPDGITENGEIIAPDVLSNVSFSPSKTDVLSNEYTITYNGGIAWPAGSTLQVSFNSSVNPIGPRVEWFTPDSNPFVLRLTDIVDVASISDISSLNFSTYIYNKIRLKNFTLKALVLESEVVVEGIHSNW